jgi:hypothetical protein
MEKDDNIQILLFDTVVINSSEDLEKFINGITDEQKIYMLKLGIQKAYSEGVFSLPESEILSKCMRTI